jgi:geranylgeranyl reductase family protein
MATKTVIYDVIIVGGGPGGSTAARELGSKGIDVLVIDKKKFPRDKTCGGFVPAKALNELGFHLPKEFIRNEIRSLSLYGKKLEKSSYHSSVPLGITITRLDLDQFLINKAIGQGVRFIDETRFYHMEQQRNIQKIYTSSGEYYCRILLGSDGMFSKVRKYVEDNPVISPYKTGFTISTMITKKISDDDDDFKLFSVPVPFSMGWAIPMGEKELNVGIGGPMFKKEELLKEFQSYIKKLNKIYQLEDTQIKIRGAFLPAGGFKRKIMKDQILLIGDAAGFADPLTGEGIYYAVKSGKIAAEAIHKGNLKAYENQCAKEFNSRFKKALLETGLALKKEYLDIKILREKKCQSFARRM